MPGPSSQGIPEVPSDLPVHHRQFLTAIRNVLLALQEGRSVVSSVTNVKVTPIGAANVIQFSRPLDADSVTLYTSTSADFAVAVPVQLGLATVYRDETGQAQTRWYWLRTKRGQLSGTLVGPFKSTSLAAGTNAAIPAAPPALGSPVQDSSTGHRSTGTGRGINLE